MAQRSWHVVPRPVCWLLLAALVAQIAWRALQPAPPPRAEDLHFPPGTAVLRLASLGDSVTAAKLLMLWLQLYDNQPGISIPFRELDYVRVEAWLEQILSLDPRAQYPLLAASRLYGAVPDPVRQRRMLEFVYRSFLQDPGRRWPWLAHGVIVAKHELRDPELALKYAAALADKAHGREKIPAWARQMHIFVLEDMGHLEAARILIGGLLESGRIRDPQERRFWQERLAWMARQQNKSGNR